MLDSFGLAGDKGALVIHVFLAIKAEPNQVGQSPIVLIACPIHASFPSLSSGQLAWQLLSLSDHQDSNP